MAFTAPTEQVVEEGDNLRTAIADEDVIRGQLVKVTTGGDPPQVAPSDTDGEQLFGMATQTVAAGESVNVATEGTEVRLTAGDGSVTANTLLASHGGTGEEGQAVNAATGDYPIAYAYEASGAQGDLVFALLTFGGQVN